MPLLQATAHRVDNGNRSDNNEEMAHHPHPASQATACRVDCAWNDDSDNDDNDKQQQLGPNDVQCHLGPM